MRLDELIRNAVWLILVATIAAGGLRRPLLAPVSRRARTNGGKK